MRPPWKRRPPEIPERHARPPERTPGPSAASLPSAHCVLGDTRSALPPSRQGAACAPQGKDGRNAEPAALFPPAHLPNSLPGVAACPPSPPASCQTYCRGPPLGWTALFRSEARLAASGCACCACNAPGFQLPFPAAILRIVPRARRAVPPFRHFEPRIDPARHRPLRMRHRADKPVDGRRAGRECARQFDQHAAGRAQGRVAGRGAVHGAAVPAIRPDAANRIAAACPAID